MRLTDAIARYALAMDADPLAGLPDDLRGVIVEFWDSLTDTPMRAACPICRAPGLSVRTCETTADRALYVLHCADARRLGSEAKGN